MQTKREKDLIGKISKQYGNVIDLKKSPGVLIEIFREFGPSILTVLGDKGTGAEPSAPPPTPPPPSSIAIAGPGSGTVGLEDVMRVILDLRQQVVRLSEKVGAAPKAAVAQKTTRAR